MDVARRAWVALGFLFVISSLSTLVYFRSLGLPLISDDYLQVGLGRQWGPVSGWPSLFSDVLYRSRFTSLVLTYWTDQVFGPDPLPFKLSALALHIFNAMLVCALGVWKKIGWKIAALASCVFAVLAGHQEAVIWYAALPELLVFTFVLLTILLWVVWLQNKNGIAYAAAAGTFLLALFSKESSVAAVPILALILWLETRDWKQLFWVTPFAAVAGVYAALIHQASTNHLHFNDGTFSLSTPFWIVLARSAWRLMWVPGVIAAVILIQARAREHLPIVAKSAAWIAITFLPYSFIKYMPFVPSRHMYMPGVGLAFLIAAALMTLASRNRARAWVPITAGAFFVMSQTGYVWTKKHRQYEERAQPTERLLEFVDGVTGPVFLHEQCFPYGKAIAVWATRLRLGRDHEFYHSHETKPPENAIAFCESAPAGN